MVDPGRASKRQRRRKKLRQHSRRTRCHVTYVPASHVYKQTFRIVRCTDSSNSNMACMIQRVLKVKIRHGVSNPSKVIADDFLNRLHLKVS
jgi:hypothetical protein